MFVVRSGPDLRRVAIMPTNSSWKNGRKYLVGFVGVIGEQEGIDLLLELVRHLVRGLGRRTFNSFWLAMARAGGAWRRFRSTWV